MHDLQLWEKRGTEYVHFSTPVTNQPYAICKAKKTAMEANTLAHFQYLKIVPNGKK